MELRPTPFEAIQHWFVDFQKKSKCFEIPPDEASILGIYDGDSLVGYYVLYGYPDEGTLEVQQGYLSKEVRHKGLSPLCMSLLEDKAREAGYSKIVLQTNRSINAYIKFMDGMGYSADKVIFSKEL